jgi:hypothetical protein
LFNTLYFKRLMNILKYLTRFVQKKLWVKIRATGTENSMEAPVKCGEITHTK